MTAFQDRWFLCTSASASKISASLTHEPLSTFDWSRWFKGHGGDLFRFKKGERVQLETELGPYMPCVGFPTKKNRQFYHGELGIICDNTCRFPEVYHSNCGFPSHDLRYLSSALQWEVVEMKWAHLVRRSTKASIALQAGNKGSLTIKSEVMSSQVFARWRYLLH